MVLVISKCLIYIYKTHTKQPRIYTGIWIPGQNDHFDHFIGFYDKGIGLECPTGEPNILFDYKCLYQENKDILDRSFAELYYATEFFWDYMNLACLLGPKEQ